ncbi:hypothetical protein ALC62_08530 [Cyphomyrmex costatus]|uniref:Uncharacterized protein n=1 Tax=Cyphomyrmex costatus TaxID=456900 RepID=A0A151IGT4_9HYME|nr:hypothetical protein ALC62_08530 [Cyphomyrmex costatus]
MLGQNNVCGICCAAKEEKTIFKETMPGATRTLAPSHGQVTGQMVFAWRVRPNGHSNQFSRKPKVKGSTKRVSRYECPLIRVACWTFFQERVFTGREKEKFLVRDLDYLDYLQRVYDPFMTRASGVRRREAKRRRKKGGGFRIRKQVGATRPGRVCASGFPFFVMAFPPKSRHSVFMTP